MDCVFLNSANRRFARQIQCERRSFMRRQGIGLIAALVLVAVALIVSCAKPYHEAGERYVFVATNTGLPYWQQAQEGFLDSAKLLGVKAELIGPTGYSPNAELVTFRQVVDQQPSGICLSAARPEIFQSEIARAVAQGIPVICVDADVPDSKRLMYIGTDNAKAGRESLKQMAAILQDKGNIAVITIPGQRNLDDRLAGAVDALHNFPKIAITKILDGKGDTKNASDLVADLLQKKEKVDGVICMEATCGSGAAETIHRLNMENKLPIVAFDDDPETLDWIDRGAIVATIAQKPYVMSYYGLKFLDDLHHNAIHKFKDWRTGLVAPMPIFVDTGTVVLDKDNLKVYREALATHSIHR
jgi:ribose transport system substrate-binding protein